MSTLSTILIGAGVLVGGYIVYTKVIAPQPVDPLAGIKNAASSAAAGILKGAGSAIAGLFGTPASGSSGGGLGQAGATLSTGSSSSSSSGSDSAGSDFFARPASSSGIELATSSYSHSAPTRAQIAFA